MLRPDGCESVTLMVKRKANVQMITLYLRTLIIIACAELKVLAQYTPKLTVPVSQWSLME